jgi:hypothetical protein
MDLCDKSLWVTLAEMETQTDFDSLLETFGQAPSGGAAADEPLLVSVGTETMPLSMHSPTTADRLDCGTDMFDFGLEPGSWTLNVSGHAAADYVSPPERADDCLVRPVAAVDPVARHLFGVIPAGVSEATRNLLMARYVDSKAKNAKNLRQVDELIRFTPDEISDYHTAGDNIVEAIASARGRGFRAVEYALSSLAKVLSDEEKAIVCFIAHYVVVSVLLMLDVFTRSYVV